MTVATARRRKTPRTRGKGATGCIGCRSVAMLSLLASPLFDSLIAPYSHLLELASPLEEKSCGPASPLERGLEDVMHVTPDGVTNAANLSLFMVKVAYHLRTGGRPHAPDYS